MGCPLLTTTMAESNTPASPLEIATSEVDEQVTETFEKLGNETRLAILFALWEAQESGPPTSEFSQSDLSFSELRDRVGRPDSGQFNYHLDKLTGQFVEQTDAGYRLTIPALKILHALLAGTLSGNASLEGEPIDAECQQCGGPVVIDYNDNWPIKRCTKCEGQYDTPDAPRGLLAEKFRPPAGLVNRTPKEFHRAGNIRDHHESLILKEGVCPECTGTVSTTIAVCDDHTTGDRTICDQCGSTFEVQPYWVCDICKRAETGPWHTVSITESAVIAFFYEHGLDPHELYYSSSIDRLFDSVEDVVLHSEDPLQVGVTYELDGDRIQVMLDEDIRVIDVTTDLG